MSLKAAVFELKEIIEKGQQGLAEEEMIKELEMKHHLTVGRLVFYYNNLLMFLMNREDHPSLESAKKVNRKWTKNEVEFMQQYIKERQEEGALNITDILEEAASLLDRGYQSVNYKYYSKIKSAEKKQKQPELQFTTISEDELPVASTELIESSMRMNEQTETVQTSAVIEQKSDDDLLDILSGLITNVQQLPGIQLQELLKSLYMLTNMALENQGALQQLEAVKTEADAEKQEMQKQLERMEKQLQAEKKRNDLLQSEVAKLANEISAFSQLEDTAKIKNLKSYNQRLNYLIDRSGVVLKVGS